MSSVQPGPDRSPIVYLVLRFDHPSSHFHGGQEILTCLDRRPIPPWLSHYSHGTSRIETRSMINHQCFPSINFSIGCNNFDSIQMLRSNSPALQDPDACSCFPTAMAICRSKVSAEPQSCSIGYAFCRCFDITLVNAWWW